MIRLTNGASVRLTGKLVESPGAGQEHELQVDVVDVLGGCDPEVSMPFSSEYIGPTECYFRHIRFKNKHSPWIICGIMHICEHALTPLLPCCESVTKHCRHYTDISKCVHISNSLITMWLII
jgi:hypothetical protein